MKPTMENRKKARDEIFVGTANAVKCSSGYSESFSHKAVKFFIANYCWERNIQFMTEVSFKDGQRADIVILDWAIAIEVLHSEKLRTFDNKKYPLSTIPVSSLMSAKQVYEMLEDLGTMNGGNAQYYITKNRESFKKGEELLSLIDAIKTTGEPRNAGV